MYLTPGDLAAFATIPPAKAQAMIDDAEATAATVAPCLTDPSKLDAIQSQAVMSILRRAILRWHEVGSGAVSQQTAGPFSQSVDTIRASSRGLFWPTEITALQDVCKAVTGERRSGAFSIGTGSHMRTHQPWCDLAFGAGTCSCGAALTRGYPIWEY